MVTARRTIMTPTRNMATHTPPIIYRLSLGASENKDRNTIGYKSSISVFEVDGHSNSKK